MKNNLVLNTIRKNVGAGFNKIVKLTGLDKTQVSKEIAQLLKERKIYLNKNNNMYYIDRYSEYTVSDNSKTFQGVITLASAGFGFVKVKDEEQDFFISKDLLGGATQGDEVIITPIKFLKERPNKKNSDKKYNYAKVIEVVTRNKTYFVGEVSKVSESNQWELIPDDNKMYHKIIISNPENIVPGSKVIVRIEETGNDFWTGQVTKIIGHKNDPNVQLLSIVHEYGVKTEFDKETTDYVDAISEEITDDLKKNRRDITDWNIYTIDPEDAKDLDDAVFVKKNEDGTYFLSVSIADLSPYVPLDSPVDKEATVRGTSVYLVDRVIPMIPHKISNNLCSLNPNVIKLTTTCDMTFDKDGRILKKETYASFIKSKIRFSYDEVNDYFDNKNKLDNVNEKIKQSLRDAKELHLIIRKYKESLGYIDFDIKEPKILVDKDLKPIEIFIKERGTAQKMIEDFMISANEAVTEIADEKKVPFLYRIHDKPSIEKLKTIRPAVARFGIKIENIDESINSKVVASWLKKQKDNPNYELAAKMILRGMAKAKYSVENHGHFGLASKQYTHYTSPIRRYPDLMVNRLLWMYLYNPSGFTQEQKNGFIKRLSYLCDLASINEMKAVETERAVNSMKIVEYISYHLDEEYEAVITTLTGFGMFVELSNTVEGLINFKNIDESDYYEFDESRMVIYGKNTGKQFYIGDKIKVKVVSANIKERKIDLKLIKKI
jgi:ribonuclease R